MTSTCKLLRSHLRLGRLWLVHRTRTLDENIPWCANYVKMLLGDTPTCLLVPPARVKKLTLIHTFFTGRIVFEPTCKLRYLMISGAVSGETARTWHLPDGLLQLDIGQILDLNPISLHLPQNLHTLWIMQSLEANLIGWELPSGLKRLGGIRVEQPLYVLRGGSVEWWSLPAGLKKFHFRIETDVLARTNEGDYFWPLPDSIEEIKMCGCYNISISSQTKGKVEWWKLPRNLKRLHLPWYFNQPVTFPRAPDGWPLPPDLKELRMGPSFNQKVSMWKLPSHLTQLHLSEDFNHPVSEWVLPTSIETLTFGKAFNQEVHRWKLPESLKVLCFGQHFNQAVFGWQLPEGLLSLSFGQDFNQTVFGWQLPEGLRTLSFGKQFNRPVRGWKLPEGLRLLIFGEDFNQPVENWTLPEYLADMRLGAKFDQDLVHFLVPKGFQTINIRTLYWNETDPGFYLLLDKRYPKLEKLAACGMYP